MVKLADFGVAMKLSEAHADDQDVVGSPYWIAPEIIEMSTPTAACDIWFVVRTFSLFEDTFIGYLVTAGALGVL
jgi:serine/threonine protein kinase